ncbi:MAG: SCO family protein [Ahrensia sp.]|nr:SCO family protein [Ahrensia sp.]
MQLSGLRKFLWVLVCIVALGFAGLLLMPDGANDRVSDAKGPAFHATFKLTDHRGEVRTEKDFAGRWMLVFFGFTNCPDVCPTTLAEVAAVLEGLGKQSVKVQPIFVSVDPERDTPAILADYVLRFNSEIIGLTGTPEQIAETGKTFPIYYERIEEAAAIDGYTMGHTSHLFLFDTKAGLADSWAYGTPAEEILADLKKRIGLK